MSALMDNIIKISISGALATPATTAFTIPLILAGGTKPAAYGTKTTKRYFDAKEVKMDWTEASAAYAIARDAFGQEVKPEYVIVAAYGATESATAVTTELAAAMSEDNTFYHILGGITTIAAFKAAGDFCNANFKVSHFDSANPDILNPTETDDEVTVLKAAGHGRVSIWYHVDPTGSGARNDSLSGGITGLRCGKDPVRGTWAHKGLQGITVDPLDSATFVGATGKNANVYCGISGVARTFFGTMANGTFIDSVIKTDWIRARVQERLFVLLGSANEGYGLTLDDDGIQAVGALIIAVLAEAADDNHKYILPDYTVTVPKASGLSDADKAKRNLPLVKFKYSIRESIHTVKTIEGAIVA